MYTVTFQDENQTEQISRFFETIRAARKWAKWLGQQSFTRTVSLYRGQAGEELLERNVKPSGPVDVSTITEYGLTQKLSNSIRCF